VRQAFTNAWSPQARAFLKSRLNPFAVVRDGEEALHAFLSKVTLRSKWSRAETRSVFLACQSLAAVCELSRPAGTVNEEFFTELQDEIARELRLMEAEEAESDSLARRIAEIYRKLHPSDNLRTIPGVGEHTAPVFLAAVGDPLRFRSQSAFANWEGVVPGARQSSNVEAKGLRMTKAGPSIMRMALYQAGDIGRRWDTQLGARVLAVLKEDRPYELRDPDGKPISKGEARKLILSEYHVPEDIRRERRRRKREAGNPVKARRKDGETATHRTNEAAKAPQPVGVLAISRKPV